MGRELRFFQYGTPSPWPVGLWKPSRSQEARWRQQVGASGRANQYINAAGSSKGRSDLVPKAPSLSVRGPTALEKGDTGGLAAALPGVRFDPMTSRSWWGVLYV